jgi:benzoylformate decarboxylase
MARSGRDALLEVLRSEGVTHLFGNPGTTELPLMDALASADDLRYVLALQEATAVGMADGYAQVTGRPAVLNLHTSAGLGNAVGNLTNAQANGTPLVVTAGQQDRRHLHHDPLLAGDLVGLATSVSKWTHEVTTLGELGTILRRAFSDAASAPSGPVFVSIPMDLLEEVGDAPVPARSTIERRAVAGGLDRLATMLAEAAPDRLLLVAGDEVAASGAVPPSWRWPRPSAARCTGPRSTRRSSSPPTTRSGPGPLPPQASGIGAALGRYDTVLLIGGRAFTTYPWSPGPAVPPEVALLHLSPDAHQLGRTWPTRLGLGRRPPRHPRGAAPAGGAPRRRRRRPRIDRAGVRPGRHGAGGLRGQGAGRLRRLAHGPRRRRPRPPRSHAPRVPGGGRGHHHRHVRPGLPPGAPTGAVLLLPGRRARVGHARRLRGVPRRGARAGALRRR